MSLASRKSDRALLLLLALLVAAIGIVLIGRSQPQSTPAHTATFAGPMLPAGLRAASFALADQEGRVVSLARYRGRVVVLSFIHSLCADACPLMVEQIKGALNQLPAAGRSGVAAIGISVNPAQDSRARRRAFLAKHEMTGRLAFLSGTPDVLRRVWHAYAIQPDVGSVAHSAFVLLIDKRGVERIGFPADQLTAEDLAHDITRLQREPS